MSLRSISLFKCLATVKKKSLVRNYSFSQKIEIQNDDLRGIFPQLTTPFDKFRSEKIDWKNLESNIIHLNKNKFSGYVINGYYGENPHLSFKERTDICKVTRDLIGKKTKIIVSSNSSSIKKIIDSCEEMKIVGADYLLLNSPAYYRMQMTYNSILEYYIRIADKSPLPLIINNAPLHTLIDYPAELCIDLANHPNIVALKESSNNIARISFICEEIRQRNNSEFCVLAGATHFLLDALRAGAVGGISALACVLGENVLELYELNEADKLHGTDTSEYLKKARILQKRLIEPDLIIEEMLGVPGLKSALDSFNFYGGPCRMPLLELSEMDFRRLRESFETDGWKFDSIRRKQNKKL